MVNLMDAIIIATEGSFLVARSLSEVVEKVKISTMTPLILRTDLYY